MFYNKLEIFQQAKEAIIDNELVYMYEVVEFVPCERSRFYDFFPHDSEESEEFKVLLNANKVKIKREIRAKLKKSDKAAELLALYRLMATPEEHRMLNQSYIDHTTKQKEIKLPEWMNETES